jgi:multidrug transporter EmrE-like cation transporter
VTIAPTSRSRSLHVSLTSFLLLLFAVATAATGQVMLKHGMTQASGLAKSHDRALFATAALNLWVLAGLVVFAISALAWLTTLSRVPLNVAYPFNALGYLGILAASVIVLDERANVWTVVGSAMVVGGLIVVVTLGPSHGA